MGGEESNDDILWRARQSWHVFPPFFHVHQTDRLPGLSVCIWESRRGSAGGGIVPCFLFPFFPLFLSSLSLSFLSLRCPFIPSCPPWWTSLGLFLSLCSFLLHVIFDLVPRIVFFFFSILTTTISIITTTTATAITIIIIFYQQRYLGRTLKRMRNEFKTTFGVDCTQGLGKKGSGAWWDGEYPRA